MARVKVFTTKRFDGFGTRTYEPRWISIDTDRHEIIAAMAVRRQDGSFICFDLDETLPRPRVQVQAATEGIAARRVWQIQAYKRKHGRLPRGLQIAKG
jgi:hypothetical protein